MVRSSLPEPTFFHTRARDSDAALDGLRRQALQREDAEGSTDDHSGARLYVSDLVHAGRLTRTKQRMVAARRGAGHHTRQSNLKSLFARPAAPNRGSQSVARLRGGLLFLRASEEDGGERSDDDLVRSCIGAF